MVADGGIVVVFVVVAELGARTQSKEWGEELAAAPWKERRQHVAADAGFLSREEEAVMVQWSMHHCHGQFRGSGQRHRAVSHRIGSGRYVANGRLNNYLVSCSWTDELDKNFISFVCPSALAAESLAKVRVIDGKTNGKKWIPFVRPSVRPSVGARAVESSANDRWTDRRKDIDSKDMAGKD